MGVTNANGDYLYKWDASDIPFLHYNKFMLCTNLKLKVMNKILNDIVCKMHGKYQRRFHLRMPKLVMRNEFLFYDEYSMQIVCINSNKMQNKANWAIHIKRHRFWVTTVNPSNSPSLGSFGSSGFSW